MKLTFITNACAIYEHDGFRLLSDPWLTEPAFGSWVHDPPITTSPQDVTDVDAIYISHIHQDHCDPGTLRHFRRDIPIICPKDRFTPAHLRRMGFSDVLGAEHGQEYQLAAGLNFRIFEPFCRHPHGYDCEVGNVIDSALLIEASGKRILNCNDNMPDVAAAEWLRKAYGPLDVAQLNYNNAGPFPACFRNLSHDEKIEAHNASIERNMTHLITLAGILNPRLVQPFAGAYKLGYGREHLNQYLGTTTPQYAAARLRQAGFDALVLEEGESIDL